MEEAALLGNSPLYGRFTEKIDLRQLDFAAVWTFFPESYTPEQLLFAWGVFGGTPYYLDGIDLDGGLGTVIQQSLLSRQGFLHDEPEYVLRTELTEPNRYFAILKAIAAGRNLFLGNIIVEIRSKTGQMNQPGSQPNAVPHQ